MLPIYETDVWLKRATFIAVLVGIALRSFWAARLGLNPDETMHLLPCYLDNFTDAAREFARFYHPPFFYYLLYALRPLFHSEFGTRLLPVVAGSLLPVVLYYWLRECIGVLAATTAALLTALSPGLVMLSTQIRSYSLAFFLIGLTLLFLDRGLAQSRPGLLAWAGSAMCLAISTDYSIALVCPAVTLYGLARLHEVRAPRQLWAAWIAVVAVAVVLFGLLYWLHVRHLGTAVKEFGDSWLAGGFRAQSQSLVAFAALASLKQFAYFAGSVAGGVLLCAAFVPALPATSLAWRLLLLAPFSTGLVLSLLGLMPFGRTRHSAITSLIIAIGIGLTAQRWLSSDPRWRFWCVPLTVACCFALTRWDAFDLPAELLDREAFREAAHYLATIVPAGQPFLATNEAGRLVDCYRAMLRLPPLSIERFRSASWRKEQVEQVLAGFRRRHSTSASDAIVLLEGGFYSVDFPEPKPSGALRRFGALRVWRLPGDYLSAP